jgi:hypothetical protein
VAGDELVDSIDERRRPDDAKEPSKRARQSDLFEECDTTAFVAWDRCGVLQNEPPAIVPSFLGHVGEQ